MEFDIESTLEDNIRLKKALQMSRFTCDQFQKQLKQLKQFYEEQQNRNNSLKADYCELNRKYQQSYTESIKDNNSLISQIEELKKIIDQKQRDMQQLQIKLIPNLDQDMLRVKLITQMQGPYQQAVDKKDRQIQRLKNKITQLQRNLQITTLGLNSKLHDLKKQNHQIKSRYEEESRKMMQELNMVLSRNQTLSVEGSIIKNQKKQIEQLKMTLEFVYQSEEKHLHQIKQLKDQRKTLLEKLMLLSSKEAFLLEGKHNMTEIQKLKDEKLKNMREIQRLKAENQKSLRLVAKLQQQKTKLSNDHEKEISSERHNFTTEKNQLNNQLYNLREELRRLKNYRIEEETERQNIQQKVRYLEKQLYQRNKENQTLRLENSRYTQRATDRLQGSYEQSKFPIGKKQANEQKQKQNDNYIVNKKKSIESKDQQKIRYQLQELKKENEKLKSKLAEANQKILELIKDKVRIGKKMSPQRQRTQSQIDKPMGVFLQYEDCGFKPLVQPTLFTYFETRK